MGRWITYKGRHIFLEKDSADFVAAQAPKSAPDRYTGQINSHHGMQEQDLDEAVREHGFQDVRQVIAASGFDAGLFPDVDVREVDSDEGIFEIKAFKNNSMMERRVFLRDKTIYNDSFFLDDRLQGQGKGSEIFSNQVENAAKAGFVRLDTFAAAGQTMNGYYTWPRLGYDADLSDVFSDPSVVPFKGATKLSDLMRTPEGRAWWKEQFKSVDVSFDLTAGSLGRRVLSAYMEARKSKSKEQN